MGLWFNHLKKFVIDKNSVESLADLEMKFLYLSIVIKSQSIYMAFAKLGVIHLKGGNGGFTRCAFSGADALQLPSAKSCAGFEAHSSLPSGV